MNNVNTIINIPPFNNKYHNNKNINGTLARDDVINAFKNDLNGII